MFQHKNIGKITAFFGGFGAFFMSVSGAFAESNGNYGLDATAKEAGLTQFMSKDLMTLVGNVIGSALSLIAVIFFILMIYGGFRWMLARGNSEDTKKALDTIFAAIIGIIIILASYAITTFVFGAIAGGASVGGGAGAGAGAGQQTKNDSACAAENPVFSCNMRNNCETPAQAISGKCLSNPSKDYVCCKAKAGAPEEPPSPEVEGVCLKAIGVNEVDSQQCEFATSELPGSSGSTGVSAVGKPCTDLLYCSYDHSSNVCTVGVPIKQPQWPSERTDLGFSPTNWDTVCEQARTAEACAVQSKLCKYDSSLGCASKLLTDFANEYGFSGAKFTYANVTSEVEKILGEDCNSKINASQYDIVCSDPEFTIFPDLCKFSVLRNGVGTCVRKDPDADTEDLCYAITDSSICGDTDEYCTFVAETPE